MSKKNTGITLVALVVTIIVLLILAGLTLNLILGDNGIITKTKEAKINYELAKAEENKNLSDLEKLFSFLKVGSDSQVTISMQDLNQYITNKISEILTAANYVTADTLNSKTSKNICELNFNTRTSYTTTTEQGNIKIPFDSNTTVGNKLSVNNNGIVIGSGISKVKVSYSYSIESTSSSTTSYYRAAIAKNNTVFANSQSWASDIYITSLAKTTILDVQEGDVITGHIIVRKAGTFYITHCNLVVEVIE